MHVSDRPAFGVKYNNKENRGEKFKSLVKLRCQKSRNEKKSNKGGVPTNVSKDSGVFKDDVQSVIHVMI